MLLRIAWLNIWRNRRRALITMASVFFAVLLAVIMHSIKQGVYNNMIDNVVSFSSGYIQIHNKGYWEEQSLDNSFQEDSTLHKILQKNSSISKIMPRLETFALASSDEQTKGIMVIGIFPETEYDNLNKKITKGIYFLNENDPAIIVGEGLARFLKLNVNDTLVLLGQGYHGISAAGKFRVKAIISLGSPQLNDNLVYLPLRQAQNMYGAENRITSLSIIIKDPNDVDNVFNSVAKKIDAAKYEVMTWKQMMPEMVQYMEADSSGHYLFIGILYLIIAFGMFSTVLMMTLERTHEFGILIAIGMQKYLLGYIILMESVMLSLVGCAAGLLASIGVIAWFINHPIRVTGNLGDVYIKYGMEPIIMLSFDINNFAFQTLVILVLSLLIALYPGIRILKLKPVEAING